jgi:hypothetical protein
VEQGERGAQLHRVERTEDLVGGSSSDGEQRGETFTEPRSQDGVGKIGPRFAQRPDREALRHRAVPEAGDLGKDEPDPVPGLAAAPQFVEHTAVHALLLVDKSPEIEVHRADCAAWSTTPARMTPAGAFRSGVLGLEASLRRTSARSEANVR